MNKILRKIIIRILFIPGIQRRLGKICDFYETVQIKTGVFSRDSREQKVCQMNFRHYLPNTEERIERLRRVINKRPVAIILPGFSARELEERIGELKDCDICYAGLNTFWPIEKYILKKISRHLSIVMNSADPGGEMDNIVDFLERPEDNIFISEKDSWRKKKIPEGFGLDNFIKKYDKKLLFFVATAALLPIIIRGESVFLQQVPTMKYPLHFLKQDSLSILLSLAVIGGASKVVLFGADGGRVNPRELYFREADTKNRIFGSEDDLRIGTRIFNETMSLILEEIYKVYNLKPIDIINCSEQSHYTPFRKLSYDKTFALLKY